MGLPDLSPTSGRQPAAGPAVVVVVTLTVVNVISNRALPDSMYVPFALLVAVALSWFAVSHDHRSLEDLGWDRTALPSALVGGFTLVVAVGVVYAAAATTGPTRPLFEDARVADLDGGDVVYQMLVRVALGTVVLEEVAFRSVVLAVFLARTSTVRAVAASSLLFGLWHVLPAAGVTDVNPVFEDHLHNMTGEVLAVVGAVAGTAMAGAVFCWLRLRTGSVLTPMLLHWATNGLGYLAAWLVLQA